MKETNFTIYEELTKKLQEISDISGCVKDVLSLLICADTNKCETLLRIEREKIDELFEIIEELKGAVVSKQESEE